MLWEGYRKLTCLVCRRNGTVASVKEIVSNLNNANLDPEVGKSTCQ